MMQKIQDFDLYYDGIGLIELITVLLTSSLVVLKVLGFLQCSWFKVLLPSTGFLIVIVLQIIKMITDYDREEMKNARTNRKISKKF